MTNTGKRAGTEARRKQILEAAIEVMGQKNYYWATTREIADTAGVSERTVFVYFKNKKEIYREAVRQATQDMLEAVRHAAPPEADIRAFLKMSERNFLAFLDEHPLKVKLLFQCLDSMGDKEFNEDFREIFQSIYELFYLIVERAKQRGEIDEDVSTLSAVSCIVGFHFVVTYVEFLKLDWFEREQDIYSVVDVFADFVTGRGK
jgi:AcrR family transcriptional regulator